MLRVVAGCAGDVFVAAQNFVEKQELAEFDFFAFRRAVIVKVQVANGIRKLGRSDKGRADAEDAEKGDACFGRFHVGCVWLFFKVREDSGILPHCRRV